MIRCSVLLVTVTVSMLMLAPAPSWAYPKTAMPAIDDDEPKGSDEPQGASTVKSPASQPTAKKPGDANTPATVTSGRRPTGAADEPGDRKRGDEPGDVRTGDEPGGGKRGDEPGGVKNPDEPGGARNPDEPGGNPEEPGKRKNKKKAPESASYGIGAHVRGIFIPNFMMKIGFEVATAMNSISFGGEFIRRKGNLDIIASANYALFEVKDGNFLGRGKAVATDSDFIQFKNWSWLSFNVHLVWHYPFTEWLSLVYGVGLGVGINLGSIMRISNGGGDAGAGACNYNNIENINECYPKGMDTNNREQWLEQHSGQGKDTPENPHRFKADIPPVLPVLHLLIGVNFKLGEQFSIRVDGGFQNALYVGATSHYFF